MAHPTKAAHPAQGAPRAPPVLRQAALRNHAASGVFQLPLHGLVFPGNFADARQRGY